MGTLVTISHLALDLAEGANSLPMCVADVHAWLLHSERDADFGVRSQDSARI